MRLSTSVLITEAQIRGRVEAMASAIAADTPEGSSLSVLAILDGAFMFCADLVRRLPMPVHIALVPMISVDRGGDPERIVLPADFPIRGRDLLLVEDILDSGKTLDALRIRLARESPARIRLAVLLDKAARRSAKVTADYVGFAVEDRWIVGYGLDWHGLYRNLPYLSHME